MSEPTKHEIIESIVSTRLHQLLDSVVADVVFELKAKPDDSVEDVVNKLCRKVAERFAMALIYDKVMFTDTDFFRRKIDVDTPTAAINDDSFWDDDTTSLPIIKPSSDE